MHKTKIFKEVFQKNADQFSSEINEDRKVMSVMTQDTFVPLMGEMWAKAKAKYAAKHAEYMVFVKWIVENYTGIIWSESDKTLEQLYKIWKKEK